MGNLEISAPVSTRESPVMAKFAPILFCLPITQNELPGTAGHSILFCRRRLFLFESTAIFRALLAQSLLTHLARAKIDSRPGKRFLVHGQNTALFEARRLHQQKSPHATLLTACPTVCSAKFFWIRKICAKVFNPRPHLRARLLLP